VIAWTLIPAALLLAVLSLRGDSARRKYFQDRLAERLPDNSCPPATVIVPVKGYDEGLAENLAALAMLDYPDYELIVAVHSAADLPPGVMPASARLIIAGAGDSRTGQKIQNLLAAIENARPASEIFAFADSDGRAPRGWLRALALGLHAEGAGAATGYRWYVPAPPDFWSNLRAVWNAAIAGTFGPGGNEFCWGGAMAIRREIFERVRVREFWRHRVSDDFRLSEAVRAAGLKITFAPGAVVPCFDHTKAAEFLGWIKRQMIITRIYRPRLWWTALIAHIIYCGAMIAGAMVAPWALALIIGLGVLKSARRASMYRLAVPQTIIATHAISVTLTTWIWLWSLLSSAATRTIEWRGVRYNLDQ
jgi:cellulose synthase/poly-beta-1,6-N-acetylglucosamine synthase-like glycosyltransferase